MGNHSISTDVFISPRPGLLWVSRHVEEMIGVAVLAIQMWPYASGEGQGKMFTEY
jgi:hypothetical protein